MPYPTVSQRFIIPDLPSADEILPFLREVDQNRWYSNFGPLVRRFESGFAQLMWRAHGARRPSLCLSLASGTQALSIGLRLHGIGPGKRVLIPAVTFPACPLVVQNLGAEAVLADIDPQKWVLTPEIAKNIAERQVIDAVMPVSLYGMPLPAEEWDRFVEETGIPVVIDAAASIESQKYASKLLVAHSLHALKPFGIGEGGFLVMWDKENFATTRKTSNFGMIDRITYQPGENAKMSEYHAAVGLAQLGRWDGIKARRRRIFERYQAELAPLKERIVIHEKLQETVLSCLMATIKSGNPQLIVADLIARGVPAHRTYLPPLYAHPYFEGLARADADGKGKMPGAEAMEASVIGLPFHAFLSDEEIHHFVQIIGEVIS